MLPKVSNGTDSLAFFVPVNVWGSGSETVEWLQGSCSAKALHSSRTGSSHCFCQQCLLWLMSDWIGPQSKPVNMHSCHDILGQIPLESVHFLIKSWLTASRVTVIEKTSRVWTLSFLMSSLWLHYIKCSSDDKTAVLCIYIYCCKCVWDDPRDSLSVIVVQH